MAEIPLKYLVESQNNVIRGDADGLFLIQDSSRDSIDTQQKDTAISNMDRY